MVSNKAVFWLFSCDNHLKYFNGNASDCAALSSDISSERMCHSFCHFVINKETFFSPVKVLLLLKQPKHWEMLF
jgi:hypothetical protein